MTRSEQLFMACTSLPYPEVRDERDETSVPELEHLSAKAAEGLREDAIEYGRGLMRHYPDSDLIPAQVGMLLALQNRAYEVSELLRTVLPRCPRRYRLYAMAGQADLALNRLANAAVWWSRSVIAQCHVIDYQVYTPFYNMAHVALVLDAYHAAESFLAMSAAITPSAPHLSPALEAQLEALRQMWVAEPLRRVVEHVEANYLHGQS